MKLSTAIRSRLLRHFDLLEGCKFGRQSFSQEGEDVLVWRMLDPHPEGEPTGTYVEVGSNHPWRLSNTAFFYKRGWSGVAIDPNPEFAPLFASERPRDHFLNLGIGQTPGTLTFHSFPESAFSTLSQEVADDLQREGVGGTPTTMEVEVQPLAQALSGIWPEGKKLNLLSIDAEGMDEEIIASHDFDKFPVELLIAEFDSVSWEKAQEEALFANLKALGFLPIAKLLKSGIFVHQSFASRLGL